MPTEEDVIELEENQRLICLGDVHGDLQALKNALEVAGVYEDPGTSTKEKKKDEDEFSYLTMGLTSYDDNHNYYNGVAEEKDTWVGKNTILVQCGDILDRGSEELSCLQLLTELSQQAVKYGGKVILLYGNHESLNALGLFQYAIDDREFERKMAPIIDDELETPMWRMQYVGNQPARWVTFEPGGLLAKSVMANMKVAVKVGRTVCVHAGLTAKHLQDYGGIEGMNRDARAWYLSSPKDDLNVTYNNLGTYSNYREPVIDAEKRQTSYINSVPSFMGVGIGSDAPVWMRDYSSPNDMPPRNPKAQSMIDEALEKLDCDRMVVGHTVQRQINAALEGKAWRIDVGLSKGVVNGTPEVLEVKLENGEEVVSILTRKGKVPSKDRQTMTDDIMDLSSFSFSKKSW